MIAGRQLPLRAAAEAVGSFFLLATVVGSGIMAAKLSGGNVALSLLGNTVATGAMLVVLITVFAPLSGAHFNPAVSVVMMLEGRIDATTFVVYALVQLVGAIAGVFAAHLMFDVPVLQVSTTLRGGPAQWLSELIATFGLVMTILGCAARAPASVPMAVGLYITAAYWFTASTSFANPAVTIARSLTNTFAGIAPAHAAPFIVAQMAGALAALMLGRTLWPQPTQEPASLPGDAIPD